MKRLDENDIKNKEQDNKLDKIDDDINDHEKRIIELENKVTDQKYSVYR
jgi:uncharacterized coiled-coil protein SlyX